MFAELTGAVQSVQVLTTLLNSANKLSNYNEIVAAVAEVNLKLIQANQVALESQEKISSLQKQNNSLEEQLHSLNDWSTQATDYENVQVSSGVFVVVSKKRGDKLQSVLKYCINCFENKKRSVLQHSSEAMRKCGLNCHQCGSKVIFTHYVDEA